MDEVGSRLPNTLAATVVAFTYKGEHITMARTTNPAEKTDKPAAKKAAVKTVTEGRNPRGWLAQAVLQVCNDYTAGKSIVDEGKLLTPHRVAKVIQDRTGAEEPPSTGAVAAVFKRWEDFGFAKFHQKPFAFKNLTAKGEKDGLAGVITGRSEARKAERAKVKKAAAKASA